MKTLPAPCPAFCHLPRPARLVHALLRPARAPQASGQGLARAPAGRVAWLLGVAGLLATTTVWPEPAVPGTATGASALVDPGLAQEIQRVAQAAAAGGHPETAAQPANGLAGPGGPAAPSASPKRLEVRVGQLDSRLRLAPCQQVQAYWPAGQRLQGPVRIGLRCVAGAKAWHVYLPIQLVWWGQALVANAPLAAGTVLASEHLRSAEVELTARPDPAQHDLMAVMGRPLARPLAAGQTLRQGDLRLREWMRPGDTVKLVTSLGQVQITGEAQALTAGLEGQPVRARTESGRIVQGVATGERQITVPM